MAGLDISLKGIDGTPGAAIAEMAGAIDGTTVVSFQESLEEITKKGVTKLVLDMSKVKYVNSTGLGSLVKYADRFKSSGGGMALIKVPAKVKIVIEMLGLHAFFEICKDINDALAGLKGVGAAASAPPREAEARTSFGATGGVQAPVSQPLDVRPEPVTPPPRAAEAPSLRSEPKVAPPPPKLPESVEIGRKTVNCQACSLLLEVTRSGNFRCPRCHAVLAVDASGGIKFLAGQRKGPVELVLFPTEACGEGLRRFVSALAEATLNGGRVSILMEAVLEVSRAIQQDAYKGRIEPYHVSIDADPQTRRFHVKFSHHGDAMDPARAASLCPRAKQLNEFECLPHPRGGNIIRLVVQY